MTPEETKAAADAAAAAAAAAAAGADGKGGKTALGAGQETPEQWIPEKYQVRKDGKKDGAIDIEASMRALAKGHGELTKRMVDVGLPPEDADHYELEGLPKDFDVAEFRKDPQMQNFLKGAHSQGLTNKQINYVIQQYIEVAPGIAGAAAELTEEECIAQLSLTWKSEAELAANLKASHRAATKLAEATGMTFADIELAFGNSPVFIRLMRTLAGQMGEDTVPVDATGAESSGDWEAERVKLRDARDAIPERDTKARAVAQAKLDVHYEKRYGTGKRAPFFVKGGVKAA